MTGNHRDKAGQVEVHDKETDVIYMIEGEATFVTGGTAVGLRSTRPGQSVGTDVKDGETHHLTKGDVIVVPAGDRIGSRKCRTPSVIRRQSDQALADCGKQYSAADERRLTPINPRLSALPRRPVI